MVIFISVLAHNSLINKVLFECNSSFVFLKQLFKAKTDLKNHQSNRQKATNFLPVFLRDPSLRSDN